MITYRYTKWAAGEAPSARDGERLLSELAHHLMACGDLPSALWQLQREGIPFGRGGGLPGNRGLLQRLQQRRQELLANLDRPYSPAAMHTFRRLEILEEQLRAAQRMHSLSAIDDGLVGEILGDEVAEGLKKIRQAPHILEETGYVRLETNSYKLTPRGIRRIGQQALEQLFSQLRKGHAGEHSVRFEGSGGEVGEGTRRYEFGDAFQLHLEKTIMNSLHRQPQTPPLKLSPDDFEVLRTTQRVRSATVLMLDLSLSMARRGVFPAAKQVALALEELIRSRFPKDSLYLVGFSSYARQLRREDLLYTDWDRTDPYTNFQHGLLLARRLLAGERCANRQVILVSDGEPTAHLERGAVFFQYPPSPLTLELTLREAKSCARRGIAINLFILESSDIPYGFVTQMARLNRGRAFFTSASSLGRYVIADYLSGKRKLIQ